MPPPDAGTTDKKQIKSEIDEKECPDQACLQTTGRRQT